jgi:UDP-N-acetylglucosamine---dolichyl-phosphate N-acetylglucosaminyltransferase
MSKITIVLPAYQEEKAIGRVLESLKKEGYQNLVVVDDGSSDRTWKVAEGYGASVYRHAINRGLGGALGTGIAVALDEGSDIIVTFDSDGQHNPKDIKRLVQPIIKGEADVVIGSRLIKPKGMPVIRRIGNFGLNVITYLLFGVWTTDSQSGLRAFSRDAAAKLTIKTNRMEVSSEIIKEIGKNHLRLNEVPIKPIYTDYSIRHGQKHANAFRIVAKLVLERFRR